MLAAAAELEARGVRVLAIEGHDQEGDAALRLEWIESGRATDEASIPWA